MLSIFAFNIHKYVVTYKKWQLEVSIGKIDKSFRNKCSRIQVPELRTNGIVRNVFYFFIVYHQDTKQLIDFPFRRSKIQIEFVRATHSKQMSTVRFSVFPSQSIIIFDFEMKLLSTTVW